MSQTHQLNASTRKRSGSAALKQMRREGFVPAVLYGARQENVNIKVEAKAFSELLHSSAGENLLVTLTIEGLDGNERLALIQDVQHNPLTGALVHADFHAVRSDEKIHANVPVELNGTAAGVKAGGVLEHQIHALEVHCLPRDLPELLRFDVSHLQLGQALHVGEVTFPEGVAVNLDANVVIAIVSEPRVGGGGAEEGEGAPGGEGAAAE